LQKEPCGYIVLACQAEANLQSPDTHIPEALYWAAHNFAVDQVTAEVTRAFVSAGIESVVIKGPTIATWLYTERPRLYADSDLLVRHKDWRRAEKIIAERGFEEIHHDLSHPRMGEYGMGYPGWRRKRDNAEVDLHFAIFGLDAKPDRIWSGFTRDSAEERIGGVTARTPSYPARVLHIALHAVQHAGEDPGGRTNAEPRPISDLRLAVSKVPLHTWMKALALAEELGGLPAFAAGLTLIPEGEALAEKIGVGSHTSIDIALRLGGVPMSEGFAALSDVSGLKAKLALLLHEAFPTPTFMRWWSPLARRGPAGLILAYLGRPFWLARHAIPGYLAWRRAKRAVQ
jgi:hypothetical protein